MSLLVGVGTELPDTLSTALVREFHKREGRDPTEKEKLALLSDMLKKGEVELIVAGCPKAVLAAARADYEARTRTFAMDDHGVAYLRGLLGDRSGVPGDEPLAAESLMKALRAELRKRLGREPSMEQIQSLLRDILAWKDEAGAVSSANHALQSVPAEVAGALLQLAHDAKMAPTTRDLLKLGRRLCKDAAASAGIPLSEVENASPAGQAATAVNESARGAEFQPFQPTFEAQHAFSAETRVSEKIMTQKQIVLVGTTRESLQLTEVLKEKYQAATFIAIIWKGRLARKVVARKRAQRTAAMGGVAKTLTTPAEDEPAAELVPLQSATRRAVAQEHWRPPPPLPANKVRAAPQLPPVNDFTDVDGAAAVAERSTSAVFERPSNHRPPPQPALPAATNDRLARAIAALRSSAPPNPNDNAVAGPNAMQRMVALGDTDKVDANEPENPTPAPPTPIEEGVQHRRMPMPPAWACAFTWSPSITRQQSG